MASTAPAKITVSRAPVPAAVDAGANHAFLILHWTFVLLPIVVGIDKFYNVLATWQNYLAPAVLQPTGMTANEFMPVVGMIEILTGVVVAFWPRFGAYLAAVWLGSIIANLSMTTTPYWDIAVADFFLLLSALALGSLSHWHSHKYPTA